jgi:hypothetical protein
MSELLRSLRLVTAISMLAVGGMILWNRRDQVMKVWDSLGGAEGIANSATKLVESVGPVREVVNQFSGLKKL